MGLSFYVCKNGCLFVSLETWSEFGWKSETSEMRQREEVEDWSALLFDREEFEARGAVTLTRSESKLGAGFSWLRLWSAGQGLGSGWGLCRGHPQAVASAVQLSGSIWGHMATSGEAPAAERGIAAATLAFWIYVGTASHQGQGERRTKWNLGVQVGLDVEVGPWQVAQFQHPSARAAGQAAPCPGLIQLAQDQLCQPSSHSPLSSDGPAGPQVMGWHFASDAWVWASVEYVYLTCSLTREL